MAAYVKKTALVKAAAQTLEHMHRQSLGEASNVGRLLAGDPGIGKTTFIETISYLLGIKAIVIEVPHITEEHLINIPFLVFNGQNGATNTGNQTIEDGQDGKKESDIPHDYKVVLANSNLYTQIQNTKVMSDEEYIEHIKTAPKTVQSIYVALGGTEKIIPPAIAQIRAKYKSILFIDELLRKTSIRIRNCLRDMLNGNIGNHVIPKDVYVVYASNTMDPGGLDVIPSNTDFREVNHHVPTSKEWFTYLVDKFEEDNKNVTLKPALIKKFKAVLDDADISANDLDADVRTSPRRWEQLLLYVNASLPVKNSREAQVLITNIKHQFINYETDEHAALHKKVLKAVTELIAETSNIDIGAGATLADDDWRDSLDHLITKQMELGNNRKYIPTLSGPPGVGKTSFVRDIAAQHDLILIDIDTSSLNAEDVIGMPLPGKRVAEDNMDISFSKPKLYTQILQKGKVNYEKHIAKIQTEEGPEAAKAAAAKFSKQKWKYLIFFDEVNAASNEKVFNALRRVLLEKNFGASGDNSGNLLKLPEGSIIVAAMNPKRTGTKKLTSHFKDIADIIPAGANWSHTKSYLEGMKFTGVKPSITKAAFNILEAFIKKFEVNTGGYTNDQKPFHLNLSGEVEVSPRNYVTAFETLAPAIASEIKPLLADEDLSPKEIRTEVNDIVFEALKEAFGFLFTKNGVHNERGPILDRIEAWIESLPDKIFGDVFIKDVQVDATETTMSDYLEGTKALIDMPEDPNMNTLHNHKDGAEIVKGLKRLLTDHIKSAKDLEHFITSANQDKIEADEFALSHGTGKVSRLENFVLSYIFTLHIHDYQNDVLLNILRALPEVQSVINNKLESSKEITEDQADDVNDVLSDISKRARTLIKSFKDS
jgi:MoxR-like ATPase